eukprot:742723-Pelagomonas_calceolata.AAC.2
MAQTHQNNQKAKQRAVASLLFSASFMLHAISPCALAPMLHTQVQISSFVYWPCPTYVTPQKQNPLKRMARKVQRATAPTKSHDHHAQTDPGIGHVPQLLQHL